MKVNKWLIVFLVILLFVLFLYFRLRQLPPPTTQRPLLVSATPIPLPITPLKNDTPEVIFEFSFPPINISSDINVYTFEPVNTDSVGKSLAEKLAFTESPRNIEGTTSMVFWSNTQGHMAISNMSFSLKQNLTSFTLIDENLAETIATRFIKELAIHPSTIALNLDSQLPLHIDENFYITEDGTKNIRKLFFSHTLDGLPVFTYSGMPAETTVVVTAPDTVYALSSPIMPEIKNKEPATIVTLESAALALQANKGTLIFIEKKGRKEVYITDVRFSNVFINGVSQAYFINEQTSRIEPVYIFEGIVQKGSEESTDAFVRFLVSALSTP